MAVSWLSRCSAIALLETRAAEHASCKLAAVCLVGGHTQHQRTRAWLHRHHHCLLQHHHLHLLVQGAVQPSHRTKPTHSAAATPSAASVGVASTHTRYMATTTLAKPPPRTRPRPASSSADTDWVHKPRRHHGQEQCGRQPRRSRTTAQEQPTQRVRRTIVLRCDYNPGGS